MTRPYDIMLAGHLCLDIIPHFPDTGATRISEIMRPGKLVNVENATISTGGPVSNTGLNMQALGNKVCFCAQVGDDVLGNLTIEMLREKGNADGVHLMSGMDSSYTVVVSPPNIDRIFLHNPGTNNEFSFEDLDSGLISQCRHFHFGYPPLMRRMYEEDGRQLQQVFKTAKEAGATTSCDVSLPDPSSPCGQVDWRKILSNILPYVDIFVPSIEEAFFMLHPEKFLAMKNKFQDAELINEFSAEEYSSLADEILALGAKMVSLKSGHRGFYLKTASAESFSSMGAARPGNTENWANRELWAPAFVVSKLASATGSGDSSIAGLLTAFLRGLSIEEALKYATCCGLQNVLVLDAVSGIHSWEETTKLIEKDLPMLDVAITTTGWKWSQELKLWLGANDSLNHSA